MRKFKDPQVQEIYDNMYNQLNNEEDRKMFDKMTDEKFKGTGAYAEEPQDDLVEETTTESATSDENNTSTEEANSEGTVGEAVENSETHLSEGEATTAYTNDVVVDYESTGDTIPETEPEATEVTEADVELEATEVTGTEVEPEVTEVTGTETETETTEVTEAEVEPEVVEEEMTEEEKFLAQFSEDVRAYLLEHRAGIAGIKEMVEENGLKLIENAIRYNMIMDKKLAENQAKKHKKENPSTTSEEEK